MPKPKALALNAYTPLPLCTLIREYNKTDESKPLERLFYLQKICQLMQKLADDPDVIEWRNQVGETGIEEQLQLFGIHRDASAVLQNFEFAQAIVHHQALSQELAGVASPAAESAPSDLFGLLKARNTCLKEGFTEKVLANYVAANKNILDKYNKDEALLKRVARHSEILALAYAKLEAIQGLTQQSFDEYQTKVLGNPDGNNKNFIFNIDGDDDAVVIRVEDRSNLGKEDVLQSHEVSEYFSEDYATLMVPFKIGEEEVYQPVVICERASEGDLGSYLKRALSGKTPEEIAEKAQAFFTQMSDFCVKLIESGHYHPDIKLSNFLTDGERLIVSDRKTIIDNANPYILGLRTSPQFAAPEVRKWISEDGQIIAAGKRQKIDMPSYMAFQLGMALKEFMLKSDFIDDKQALGERFEKWEPITKYAKNPPDSVKNYSVLIQELTRADPKDRLPIHVFQELMSKHINLPHEDFLAKLEELAPKSKLLSTAQIELVRTVLNSDPLTEKMASTICKIPNLTELFNDPRASDLRKLLDQPKIKASIGAYLNAPELQREDVDKLLHEADLKKAGWFDWALDKIFGWRVPAVSTVADISDKLPKINPEQQTYMVLATAAKCYIADDHAAMIQKELYLKYTAVQAKAATDMPKVQDEETLSDDDEASVVIKESSDDEDAASVVIKESSDDEDAASVVIKESSDDEDAASVVVQGEAARPVSNEDEPSFDDIDTVDANPSKEVEARARSSNYG